MLRIVGTSMTLALGLAASADARAHEDAPGIAIAEPEDHHARPPEYDDPDLVLPPASADPPQYPLAAQYIPADSTNYSPGGITDVQYVVVHTMQGSYAGSISWFQNPVADVSAHFCMRAEDGEITQMVRLADKAWHVGNSNPVAIGIEHEGYVDDPSWYTWPMYTRSAQLARWLADRHGLPLDRDHIVGHVDLPNQTHTDPGPNWNWDLYMALVRDVVGEGVVEGVVVDASRACTLTAAQDTWVKATLQDADALADADKCLVPAGTELAVLSSSDDILGHRRLAMPGTGPCAEAGSLAQEGFVFAAHFTGSCSPETVAAPGAQIVLDGGVPVVLGPDGRFALTDVGAGAHTIDASAAGYVATTVPFDQAVYPGARLVVVLEPEAQGTSGEGSSDGGESTDGSEPDDDSDGGIDSAGTDDDGGDGVDPALPGTFGEVDEATGCGCRAGHTGGDLLAVGLGLFALATRRRRGASRPGGPPGSDPRTRPQTPKRPRRSTTNWA